MPDTSLNCDNHLTLAQRADVGAFADVISLLPGRTNLIEHHFQTHSVMTCVNGPIGYLSVRGKMFRNAESGSNRRVTQHVV